MSSPRKPEGETYVHAAVWVGLCVVSSWVATRAVGGRVAFPIVLAIFAAARLLTFVGDVMPGAPGSRTRQVVGALVVSGPLATGLLFVSLGIAALVVFPHGLGIVLGIIGLLLGQGLVIAGVGIERNWWRAADPHAKVDPSEG